MDTRTSTRTWPDPWRIGWALGLSCAFLGKAHGAGIAIMEQSVRELGQGFAGAATGIEDGSAVFFNPAGVAETRGARLTLAGYIAVPSSQFRDAGSTLSPRVGGTPLTGNDGGDGGVTTLIPNLYYVQELTDRVVLGLGVNAPFGVHNNFDPGWQGRYQAIESEIHTINVSPVFAVRLSEQLNFGAGLDVQYFHAKLSNAIDFGTVCFQALGPAPCRQRGLTPQGADGRVKVEGESVAFGYHLGVLYAPNPGTRFGVSYRSPVDHEVAADADYFVPKAAVPLTQTGRFADTPVHAPVRLPDSVLFGFHHRLDDRWVVMGDALWTHWSRVDSLTLKFSSPRETSVQRLGWRDTWRLALGVNYRFTPRTVYRIGFAYDESPVPDPELRVPRIPDSDRYWLTAGVTYQVVESLTLSGAYAHLFFRDAPIRHVGQTGDRLVGRFSNHVDIVGLQMDWRF